MSKRKETEFGTIPIHWDFIKASEYCSKVTDGTHDSPKQQTTGRYLITSKHIKGREIDFESAYLISQEDFEKINKRSYVERWDVIISMIGEYCGFTYIERNEKIDYAVKNVGLFKTGSELNALWLHYFLNSTIGKYILDINKSGSSQPYIALGSLRELPILIPPLNEKTAIVSILSSLEDKIDLLHRQNATLEKMAETLFRQWFVEEAKEEWEMGKVSDLIKILSGFAFKSSSFVESGKYRLITIKGVQDGYLELNNADKIEELPDRMPDFCKLQIGDILLSLTGNVGRCCLVDTTDLLLNQRVAKLHPINERDRAYTYFLFRQPQIKQLLEEMGKGTAQSNLSPIETSNMELIIPDKEKLTEFSTIATPVEK